jgi:rare lipoprotein A (peptidoglycan hydrolase)
MRKINWPDGLVDFVTWTMLALAVIGSCWVCNAVVHRPATVVALTPLPAPRTTIDPLAQYGWASWYGKPFHGQKTASGAIYDMGGYSVAHKTMALGAFVRIENMRNGRWCVAVVNDRGPYVEGRDWDVSNAVAKRLGMTRSGVVPVAVKEVR